MTTHSTILAAKISRDRRAWWTTVHGVTKSQIRLSDWIHAHTRTQPEKRLFQAVQSNGKHLEGPYVIVLSSVTTIHLEEKKNKKTKNTNNNHITLEGQKYIISVNDSCNVYLWECSLDIYITLEELTTWAVSWFTMYVGYDHLGDNLYLNCADGKFWSLYLTKQIAQLSLYSHFSALFHRVHFRGYNLDSQFCS